MHTGRYFLLIFLLLAALHHPCTAQKSMEKTDPAQAFRDGISLFAKEKYGAAQACFGKILDNTKLTGSETGNTTASIMRSDATYYYAVCAMELFHKDAEYLLSNFVTEYPESPKAEKMKFMIGRFYYRQKRFKLAAEWFEKTDLFFLTKEESHEYYFKTGYSFFNTGNYEKAGKAFYEIKDIDTKYTPPANYYYAHIAYTNKNYETALQSFLKLKDSEGFSVLVPSYITQIYYLQGKYSQLVEYAVPLLAQGNPQNSTEITHLAGESYYRMGQFREAIPFLEEYQKFSGKITREDYYELGYCRYRAADYEKAVESFSNVDPLNDILSQNTFYHLASCFISINKKQNARSAFRLASRMTFDKDIREDALFSYAKLCYEISLQADAVNAFRQYLAAYPSSPRSDQANEYLADIFMATRNYKDAIPFIDNINNKSQKIKLAGQKAYYYYALEFLNDGKNDESLSLLGKSLEFNSDEKLTALATYWKGEALYRLKKYEDAIKAYNDFLYTPSALKLPLYNPANYNTGYCYFKMEDYANAVTWFRKYLKNKEETDKARYNDALLRTADGFLMQREFANAAEYYDDAIRNKAASADYALFQRAVIYGLQNRLKDKISTLDTLAALFPKSNYSDDALYERGNAEFLTGREDSAFSHYKKLIDQFPKCSYVKKALLGIALIYFNHKEDSMALGAYKTVISDYPATPEAKSALVGIKNVYVGQGNSEAYLAYAATVPFANVDKASQDSITYEAAEVRYMKNDCKNASGDMETYLSKFPDGAFVLNANFYKAECDFRNREYDKALPSYTFVINASKNTFTETALLRTAGIYFMQKQYENSLKNYSTLEEVAEYKNNIQEAVAGKMKCNFLLGKYQSAVESAAKLLTFEKIPGELAGEAHLISGKSELAMDSVQLALPEFAATAKSASELGAEAKYNIALIYYKQGHFKDCEKAVFDLVNQVPSYDEWIAKGFLLLSDNYMAQSDAFQAKATLQSLLDNYEGADSTVKNISRDKLNLIIEKEKQQQQNELQEKLVSPPDTTNGGIERE